MIGTFAEVSGLPVVVRSNGKFVLTRKFIDGMERYAERWKGNVVAVMNPVETETSNLDNVEISPGDVSFQIKPIPFSSKTLREFVCTCGFVHWFPHRQLHDLAGVMSRNGVPNSIVTEYSLQTRYQIIQSLGLGFPRRIRKYWWEWCEERKIRANIRRSTGLDANGTPTYDAYKKLNPQNLLFFDSRMSENMFIDEASLSSRLESLHEERPLRMMFSGRLNEMKGAMDLLLVAKDLKSRGVDFQLEIFGGGTLEDCMRQFIQENGLADCVFMRGVLSFADSFVPRISSTVDLFLCCHKQGDPSCTYLETFACGIPIAGYLNEAFAGLLSRTDAGWGVPMDQPDRLADVLQRLAMNRLEIAAKARNTVRFARDHSFESTFQRRMDFFESCVVLSSDRGLADE